jgi:predicted ATPase
MSETNGSGTTDKVLIKRIKVSGLLSFGPTGIDLPMRGLNVLIGANGSGKSNFLEILALLRWTPQDLTRPMRVTGDPEEWLWKPRIGNATKDASIEVSVSYPGREGGIRHEMKIGERHSQLEVVFETIEDDTGQSVYDNDERGADRTLTDHEGTKRSFRPNQLGHTESVLSQIRDPVLYPALARLQEAYGSISMFRDWSFGPNSFLRREQATSDPRDFLKDGGANLGLTLLRIIDGAGLEESLQKAYGGLERVNVRLTRESIRLSLTESGDRRIPATRISDGTLRYLCLLAILLHPDPPPFVAIEEPELGLHPDLIHHVADLLKNASRRTQLVVTTHSRRLIDELGDQPESVVICEKHDGESTFERLDGERMKHWLDRYSLGDLWSSGELGGNRW